MTVIYTVHAGIEQVHGPVNRWCLILSHYLVSLKNGTNLMLENPMLKDSKIPKNLLSGEITKFLQKVYRLKEPLYKSSFHLIFGYIQLEQQLFKTITMMYCRVG